MQRLKNKKAIATGIIGNILEHYDTALFALLAPFLAPLFFPSNTINSLIATYSLLPLGLIGKPLGALFFGRLGDAWGRKQSLYISLFGMSITTLLMGCLPTYQEVGAFAPILLSLCRLFQCFFAAGEVSGGAVFVLEHHDKKEKSLLSSLYDASSVLGIFFASFAVSICYQLAILEDYWRALFWIGSFSGIIGVFLRTHIENPPEFVQPKSLDSIFSVIKKEQALFFSIVFISGFSYALYSLSTTFMNGFLPLISSISKVQAMQINTYLMGIDFFLLPICGWISAKYQKERVMYLSAFTVSLLAMPCFFLLKRASFFLAFCIRTFLIVLGVLFSAPFYAWAIEKLPSKNRLLLLSFGYSVGTQSIGASASSICLWLYKITGLSIAPGIYLFITGIFAAYFVKKMAKTSSLDLASLPS